MNCTEPGCDRPILSRLKCSLHYHQQLRESHEAYGSLDNLPQAWPGTIKAAIARTEREARNPIAAGAFAPDPRLRTRQWAQKEIKGRAKNRLKVMQQIMGSATPDGDRGLR